MTTPFEKQLNADVALVMADAHGPAMGVVLVTAEGNEIPLRGILSLTGLEVSSGSGSVGGFAPGAPVVSASPILHLPLVAVQTALGRPLSGRDAFVINGVNYRVQRPLDNGYGFLTIKLLKKD